MTRRLLAGYLTIALLVLVVLEIPLGINFARTELERMQTAVERDAAVISSLVEEDLEHGGQVMFDDRVTDYAQQTRGRVVIVDAEGIVVADTRTDATIGEDFSDRADLAAALTGDRVNGVVDAEEDLGARIAYVAVPVAGGGLIYGAVRITHPTDDVDARVRENWMKLALVAVLVLAATTGIGLALGRWTTRPLAAMGSAAVRLARGDLEARAPHDHGPPEVRALAMEFNQMAGRLERLVDVQQAFVTDASHQLRSPLSALRLELENLAESADAEQDSQVQRALEQVHRLGRTVNGLLALARADRATATDDVVDLAAVARNRAQDWRPVADEAGRHVDLDVPSGSVMARGRVDLVEQVVDNLLDNALRFTPAGGRVHLHVRVQGERAHLQVRDEGPGMAPEQRERAFDRFWRAGDQDPGSGTGLGLPIARRLAQACGGELTLQDAPGGGLAVVLDLPVAPTRTRPAPPIPADAEV